MTPLRPAAHLARSLDLTRLYIKDESVQPTGSFKARGMTTAVTMARRLGAKRLALPSAGNAGGAATAYGALAGLPVDLFLPLDTPAPFRLEARACGAEVHLIDGDIRHCGARVREGAATEGWFDLSTFREPYRVEGKKTLGYEIAEQLGWELPEAIVYPTGGGTGLVGMWKAFEELERLGLVRGARRPRMIVVQASGCAPLVRAHEAGAPHARAWDDPRTCALGLRVPATLGDHLVLDAVRESGGTAVSVSDAEIVAGQLDFARSEGVFACPEGGAALAGLRRLVASQGVGRDERIVLFNTGTGLKYPRIPGLDV
jgi:threonine synthase